MEHIRIGKRLVGRNQPVFIISEIGINHNGDVDLAKNMIDESINAGVDSVKFQVFKAKDFISDPNSTYTYKSQGKNITEPMLKMFQRYEFDEKEWKEIVRYCKKKDVEFFATPQNPSDLDFIMSITEMPAIKVGSDDLTNLELMEYYAKKKKPMIISAGMAYLSEIEDAVCTIRNTGNENIVVLHCVSSYPAEPKNVNLKKMQTINDTFGVVVGFSDHTVGSNCAICAVSLGAKVIEKHFTLDKNMSGPDHWFSADPAELKKLVEGIRCAEEAIGSGLVEPTSKEMEMRKIARRSIVANKEIKKGETISREMLDFKRPGTGLPPKYIKQIVGKISKKNIARDELVTLDKIIQSD